MRDKGREGKTQKFKGQICSVELGLWEEGKVSLDAQRLNKLGKDTPGRPQPLVLMGWQKINTLDFNLQCVGLQGSH